MALTAPTVASDPATAAHTNTALAAVNTFITTAHSEATSAGEAMIEQVRTRDGNLGLIDRMTAAVATLAGGGAAAPSVVTDPASQSQTNTALATLAGYIDGLNSRFLSVLVVFRESVQRTDGNLGILDGIDADIAALSAPSSVVAPTVASNPVSQANMNTALATLTTAVDSANSESVTGLESVLVYMRRSGSSSALVHTVEGGRAALQSP